MEFINAALNREQEEEYGPELCVSVGTLVAPRWALGGHIRPKYVINVSDILGYPKRRREKKRTSFFSRFALFQFLANDAGCCSPLAFHHDSQIPSQDCFLCEVLWIESLAKQQMLYSV